MSTERIDLEDIKNRAEKFIAAHDEMCRIDQGIGGLAVERPDLMPDFDAWYHASDVEHADTALAIINALQPRTITTTEELDTLPVGSVVILRDSKGDPHPAQKGEHGWRLPFADGFWTSENLLAGSAETAEVIQ